MTPRFILTAAPVGAVSKFISTQEPRYIPNSCVSDLYLTDDEGEKYDEQKTVEQTLIENGWIPVTQGGLILPSTIQSFDISILQSLDEKKVLKQVILLLNNAGWKDIGAGILSRDPSEVETYIPPDLIETFRQKSARLTVCLESQGWKQMEGGYWNEARIATPYLPITPDAIIQASIDAAVEGASIVHLHTRERSLRSVKFHSSNRVVSLGEQSNRIIPSDFDRIVSTLHGCIPETIINLSTSVRGGSDFGSPIRRAHLKTYGSIPRVPEIASFSPGPVLFKSGGGYENETGFIGDQIHHFRKLGVRPEIEIFNHEILENAIGPYKEHILSAGQPTLFMLVAGVDQYRRTATGKLVEGSLIPTAEREKIFKLLGNDKSASFESAIVATTRYLEPIVNRIRENFANPVVSILAPGPMLSILPDLAMRLGIQGIRVGLEDALNVPDDKVVGGVKRCTTADQVIFVRERLHALGGSIMSTAEARDRLEMIV
ncbi:3-keto-5-aminohexanoate cleavage protein [Rhizobium rhizogenes]|uniref:3-keto-5-aminohexanoate cleavage protein n=1 Tax=Rhizobium rhizogenes TaxID=359 RepID=UPI001886157B|nr:3-keto-5-aminohexanoate cleavage protein [Rhizobium rhizogenes]